MITEQLMGIGNWSLRLSPDTPYSVLSALEFFGHVLVIPTPVDPIWHSDATLKGMSRFTGIVRAKPSRYEVGGPSVAAWLGDEDGKGQIHESNQTGVGGGYTDQSFRAWIVDLLPNSITAGTLTNIAGTLVDTIRYLNPRQSLDYVMDYFGGEYRVNPDATLDAGTAADLFVATPTVMLSRRGFGKDPSITGLPPVDLDRQEDAQDYTTKTIVLAEGNGQLVKTGTASAGAVPYTDLHGNTAVWERIINSPQTKSANANAVAQVQLNRFNQTKRLVTLSTDEYDVTGEVQPGDTVYVYDPEIGLYDAANQQRFQGEVLNPVALRCYGITWPVQEGMGVLYRDSTGAYTDLTPYVEWESGAATVEVGGRRRKLQKPTGTGAIPTALEGRVGGLAAYETYTPTLTATGVNPNIGATGTIEGIYTRIGRHVSAHVSIAFAGAGISAGSGQYLISLPVEATSMITATSAGAGRVFDNSATMTYLVGVQLGTSSVRLRYDGGNFVTDALPFAWATGDSIHIHFAYEAA